MKISIEDLHGNMLESIELESNPFVVGQKLNLEVINHDIDFWTDKVPSKETYIITDIEPFIRCRYDRHRKSSEHVDISVYVKLA